MTRTVDRPIPSIGRMRNVRDAQGDQILRNETGSPSLRDDVDLREPKATFARSAFVWRRCAAVGPDVLAEARDFIIAIHPLHRQTIAQESPPTEGQSAPRSSRWCASEETVNLQSARTEPPTRSS